MREKLIELLGDDVCKNDCCGDCECKGNEDKCIATLKAFMADHLIANGVTIPVRCKDCKYWKHFDHVGCSDLAKVCSLANYMIGANGYCLYGERKDYELP